MAKNRPETFIDELCAILVRHHAIDEQEIHVYKAQFKQAESSDADFDDFDQYLVDEGLVEKEDVLKALSAYYEVPDVDLEGELIDDELLRNFPKDFLVRNEIIPIMLEEDFLTVAASHPDNENLLSGIGKYVNTDIEFQVALAQDIIDAVEQYYDKSLTDQNTIARLDEDVDEENHEREEFEKEGEYSEEEE